MKLKNLFITTMVAMTPLTTIAQETNPADLTTVTSNIDMDGHYFMANQVKGDLQILANLGNDWMKTAAKNGKKNIPQDVDLQKLLTVIGADQVTAYGRSAKFAGDHWVNKMFLQTNGSNQGILSFSGEKAQPFAVAAFAPAGTDLAMEMNFDARQATSMMKAAEKLCKCPKTKKLMENMSRKMPSGVTAEEMLNNLNLRVSVAIKLDDEKRDTCPIYPEYTFPALHSCVRIHGSNTIWKEVGALSKWMMKHEPQEDGTILLTPHKPMTKGMMKDLKPVILVDEKNNVIWAASSIEFLKECTSDNAKLKDDEAFKSISGGMTEGNGLAYISKQTCMEIRQVKEAKYKKMDKKMFSDETLTKIMDHLTESKNGYFGAMTKSDEGIHMVLKTPCPIKETHSKKGYKKSKKRCKKCAKSTRRNKSDKGNHKPQCKCPAGECKCGN